LIGAAPGLDERLLEDFAGVFRIAQNAQQKGVDRRRVPIVELLECDDVALRDRREQRRRIETSQRFGPS